MSASTGMLARVADRHAQRVLRQRSAGHDRCRAPADHDQRGDCRQPLRDDQHLALTGQRQAAGARGQKQAQVLDLDRALLEHRIAGTGRIGRDGVFARDLLQSGADAVLCAALGGDRAQSLIFEHQAVAIRGARARSQSVRPARGRSALRRIDETSSKLRSICGPVSAGVASWRRGRSASSVPSMSARPSAVPGECFFRVRRAEREGARLASPRCSSACENVVASAVPSATSVSANAAASPRCSTSTPAAAPRTNSGIASRLGKRSSPRLRHVLVVCVFLRDLTRRSAASPRRRCL